MAERHRQLKTAELDSLVIEENNTKWDAVINSVTDAIIVIDELGYIHEANSATEKLFGYDVESLLGENISLLMPEPYRSEPKDYIKRYLATDYRRTIGMVREVLAIRKTGEVFPIAFSVNETRYDDTLRFVGVIRDLTRFMSDEKRLIKAQKTELHAQFTAGIAHDFNNLLTVIQGNLEMLEPHLSQKEDQALLGDLLAAVEDGNHMTRQLFAFGRKQFLKS